MSVDEQLITVARAIRRVDEDVRNARNKMIALTEDFATARRLVDADTDEFGQLYAEVCDLKQKAVELFKRQRRLRSASVEGD